MFCIGMPAADGLRGCRRLPFHPLPSYYKAHPLEKWWPSIRAPVRCICKVNGTRPFILLPATMVKTFLTNASGANEVPRRSAPCAHSGFVFETKVGTGDCNMWSLIAIVISCSWPVFRAMVCGRQSRTAYGSLMQPAGERNFSGRRGRLPAMIVAGRPAAAGR